MIPRTCSGMTLLFVTRAKELHNVLDDDRRSGKIEVHLFASWVDPRNFKQNLLNRPCPIRKLISLGSARTRVKTFNCARGPILSWLFKSPVEIFLELSVLGKLGIEVTQWCIHERLQCMTCQIFEL